MTQLRRKLNLYGLTMIAVGSCIGSGIFVTPYKVVEAVPNHSLVLLVWALGGLIALTGALTFAELGGMFPNSGGVYVYLREAYGKLAGFLYGGVILLLFFWGTFYNLISYVTFMDIAFMALAGASVFVLRKRRPEAERPYRVWGYPVVPGIFVGISGAFVVNTLFAQPAQALAGLVLLGLGVGCYYFFFRAGDNVEV